MTSVERTAIAQLKQSKVLTSGGEISNLNKIRVFKNNDGWLGQGGMELAQDDSPVPLSTEQTWQSQYWCEGYVPNETVTVKSLLEVANSEHDRYLEGNEILQRAIYSKTNDIKQLKIELADLKLQKPILEGKISGAGNQILEDGDDASDVVEAVVTYGIKISNWIRYSLNAFRVFIPM